MTSWTLSNQHHANKMSGKCRISCWRLRASVTASSCPRMRSTWAVRVHQQQHHGTALDEICRVSILFFFILFFPSMPGHILHASCAENALECSKSLITSQMTMTFCTQTYHTQPMQGRAAAWFRIIYKIPADYYRRTKIRTPCRLAIKQTYYRTKLSAAQRQWLQRLNLTNDFIIFSRYFL